MLSLAIVAAAMFFAESPAKVPTADDYAGRWNVRITDADNTFTAGGLKIEKKAGGLAGTVVWRGGSVVPAKSVVVEDGTLRLRREEEPG